MSAERDIAVVVVCQDRTAYVDECLTALRTLAGGPWPIVVVPDALIEAYAGSEARQVPCRGSIARKRNVGLAACPPGCRYVAFVDSDARPRQDWLQVASAAICAAPPGTVAWSGPELTPSDDPYCRRVTGLALASPFATGRAAATYRRPGAAPVAVRRVSTCNLVVSREAVEAVGGFDEGVLTSEDVALSDALLQAGGTIAFLPEQVVYHHRRDVLRFAVQWFNEGLAVRHYRRWPRAGTRLVVLPPLKLAGEVLVAMTLGLSALGVVQLVEVSMYALERSLAGVPLRELPGTVLAMWLFHKAYGLGGILSLVGGTRWYVSSRHDPAPSPDHPR